MTAPVPDEAPLMPRSENLSQLAAAVREFVEPRHHSEMFDVWAGGQLTRQPHVTTHPGLLQALEEAACPGRGEQQDGGGFESRPAASIPAVTLLRQVRDGTARWAGKLGCRRPTLARSLSALVGARHTDVQLDNLRADVVSWQRRAEVVVGWVDPPLTLNQSCPTCGKKHTLVVTGDLRSAVCSYCGTGWDENTIGILGQMLTANQTVETMTRFTVCGDPGEGSEYCYLSEGHSAEHRDQFGRWWRHADA